MKKYHLLKVIIGFCGMIIFGLISLTIIDSLKAKGNTDISPLPIVDNSKTKSSSVTLPPVKKTTTKKVTQ